MPDKPRDRTRVCQVDIMPSRRAALGSRAEMAGTANWSTRSAWRMHTHRKNVGLHRSGLRAARCLAPAAEKAMEMQRQTRDPWTLLRRRAASPLTCASRVHESEARERLKSRTRRPTAEFFLSPTECVVISRSEHRRRGPDEIPGIRSTIEMTPVPYCSVLYHARHRGTLNRQRRSTAPSHAPRRLAPTGSPTSLCI